jgi:hypothetical protein
MKLHCSADELDLMDAMNDEDLVKTVRDSLAQFRAGKTADDLEPGTPSKGGKSVPTLETVASRAANTSANDAARAAHRRAASDMSLTAADRASHRLAADDYHADEQRTKATAKIIPGYDRL